MKAAQIMDKLFEYGAGKDYSHTCDTCNAGDPETEVTKVAVTMFPTVDVVKQAKEWGAQLLIVHEPAYYDNMDRHSDEKIENEKRKLIEDSGMVLYRFHDHPHFEEHDIIAAGELEQMAFDGEVEYTDLFDVVRLTLKEPMTAVEFARALEERLNIKHLRICGTRDVPCTNISAMFGAPGTGLEELQREETEILLMGETCEWMIGEYARDAAQLGYTKTLIIMGHVGSERDGMAYTAKLLKEKLPQLEVKYFDCGEVYSYTD